MEFQIPAIKYQLILILKIANAKFLEWFHIHVHVVHKS